MGPGKYLLNTNLGMLARLMGQEPMGSTELVSHKSPGGYPGCSYLNTCTYAEGIFSLADDQ